MSNANPVSVNPDRFPSIGGRRSHHQGAVGGYSPPLRRNVTVLPDKVTIIDRFPSRGAHKQGAVGGYPTPPPRGYPTPPHSGGYPTPPHSGGYPTPPRSGGYPTPPRGYPTPPQEWAWNAGDGKQFCSAEPDPQSVAEARTELAKSKQFFVFQRCSTSFCFLPSIIL
ncbi:hypothetical protein F2Q68_00019033 [Brassica cretica]|uniref:Uncharacterized protein n=1 Tax=Brassica cretica TaxID=69181 RepID=A0A8S9FVI1_BRACR|nr:hypothetical protein F2Q68_00019033 [Brassica cretica]